MKRSLQNSSFEALNAVDVRIVQFALSLLKDENRPKLVRAIVCVLSLGIVTAIALDLLTPTWNGKTADDLNIPTAQVTPLGCNSEDGELVIEECNEREIALRMCNLDWNSLAYDDSVSHSSSLIYAYQGKELFLIDSTPGVDNTYQCLDPNRKISLSSSEQDRLIKPGHESDLPLFLRDAFATNDSTVPVGPVSDPSGVNYWRSRGWTGCLGGVTSLIEITARTGDLEKYLPQMPDEEGRELLQRALKILPRRDSYNSLQSVVADALARQAAGVFVSYCQGSVPNPPIQAVQPTAAPAPSPSTWELTPTPTSVPDDPKVQAWTAAYQQALGTSPLETPDEIRGFSGTACNMADAGKSYEQIRALAVNTYNMSNADSYAAIRSTKAAYCANMPTE